MIPLRWLWCMVCAAAYQAATNPFVTVTVLAIFGQWRIGAAYVSLYLLLCAIAVALRVTRPSRLPGLGVVVTAPDWLFVFGDEQQGWLPQWLIDKWPKWAPKWLIALSCCAWRNKLRNIAFTPWLAWLHRPKGVLRERRRVVGSFVLILRTRGWLTEFEYVWTDGRRFGDFGPRLDQPDEWGGVSWAFRPFGRL